MQLLEWYHRDSYVIIKLLRSKKTTIHLKKKWIEPSKILLSNRFLMELIEKSINNSAVLGGSRIFVWCQSRLQVVDVNKKNCITGYYWFHLFQNWKTGVYVMESMSLRRDELRGRPGSRGRQHRQTPDRVEFFKGDFIRKCYNIFFLGFYPLARPMVEGRSIRR